MPALAEIRAYIQTLLPDERGTLDTATPLFFVGGLDSVHLVPLVFYLEDHFKIKIHPLEVNADNFSNLQAIADLIQKKR